VTKAKADQTVGIRLEMQSFEREQLETLVTARAVGDVLKGVGAVLTPFGDVLSVVVAAWIAKEGAEVAAGQAKQWWINIREREEEKILTSYADLTPEERGETTYEEFREGTPGRRLRRIFWGEQGGPIWWPPFRL